MDAQDPPPLDGSGVVAADRTGPELSPAVRSALVAVVVGATLLVAFVGTMAAQADGGQWALGLAGLVAGVVALLAVAGPPRDLSTALVAVGLLNVGVGSGVVRPRTEVTVDTGDGGGDIVARIDTWWPVVLLGIVVIVIGLARMAQARGGLDGRARRLAAGAGSLVVGIIAMAALIQDVVVGGWVVGRPLRHRGRRRSTADDAPASPLASPVDVWLEAGADEAASITAFEDLAARLSAVGAPSALVERCHDAARDEVRHARQCHTIARKTAGARGDRAPLASASIPDRPARPPETTPRRRVDPITRGASTTPRPGEGGRPRKSGDPSAQVLSGPARRVALARLAVESLVDGMVGEGYAAARLRAGAGTAVDPTVARTLAAMAGDEARHAELGRDVLRWCHAESPRLVGRAVRSGLVRLPADSTPPARHLVHGDDVLRDVGMVDRATAQQLWRRTRRDATTWVGLALLDPAAGPRATATAA